MRPRSPAAPLAPTARRGHPRGTAAPGGPPREREPADRRDDAGRRERRRGPDAARSAIVALRQALANAADVSAADRTMYMSTLTAAVDAVDTAQGGLDTDTRRANQMTALSDASTALQAALAALTGTTPTQARLDAANMALADLNAAIAGGGDLTETEKAPYAREAANAQAPIDTAQMAFDDAEDDAEDAANAALAVIAAKLYAGIGPPLGSVNIPAAINRAARYNLAGTAILVSAGDGTNVPASVTLAEDEDATVADNHGWEGRRYADPAGGDMYEAVVYSDVEGPTPGKKFGGAAAGDEFAYTLVGGALNNANGLTDANAGRVAFTGVTRTAGTETFNLPDPNPGGATNILVPGTFHGVPGTYSCTPSTPADGCTASAAARGFTLAGGTWTFTPGDPNARVMESTDTVYATYGWWIKKAANDGPFTASAFVWNIGTVPAASAIDTLQGSATYRGGAAGTYALRSATGGANDAGHFTARATLEADFTGNTVSGTIDDFTGGDGMARDWSVELTESVVGAEGSISDDGTATGYPNETVWTIGGTAAAAGGEWLGVFYDNGDDGVPRVATGWFLSTLGAEGRMVGGFGVNVQ